MACISAALVASSWADTGRGEVAAAAAVPARPVCGGPPVAGGARCDGLDRLALSGGRVRNRRGRAPGPGDSGTIEVRVTNAGTRAVDYPCVGFAADRPGVSFGADNPKATIYALAPGAAVDVAAPMTIAASIRPGSVVRFTAWLDVLHGGCANGRSLAWTAVVR